VVRSVQMNPAATRVYNQLENTLRADVKAGTVTVSNALVRLLRLQQITSGFVGAETEPDEFGDVLKVVEELDDAKREALRDVVDDLPPDEPLVVFCRFRRDLDAVHAVASDTGSTSLEVSGRRSELDEWKAGGARLLAVQQRAGGVGVDMTRAAYAVWYSLNESLGDYQQACERVHRPPQQRKVTFYHLVARDTVDGPRYDALREKRDIVETVLRYIRESKMKGKAR